MAHAPEKKPSRALLNYLTICKNEEMKQVAIKHLRTLEKYETLMKTHGAKAFATRDEYQDYVIARFFNDVCIHEPMKEEVESVRSKIVKEIELRRFLSQFPPLQAFHMSNGEKMAKTNHFWKNIKIGNIINCQVLSINAKEYDLLLVNKDRENERLIDLSIKASMSRTDTDEFLIPGDLIRAVTLGYKKIGDNNACLIVTVNPAVHGLENAQKKLGQIKENDIPFAPINASNYSSMHDFIKNHPSCQDTKKFIMKLPCLGIDPYKAYLYHPELDGKKADIIVEEAADENHEKMISAMKNALFYLSFQDFIKAWMYANLVIKLCPNYAEAYVVRGRACLGMANREPGPLIKLASENFIQALKKSSGYNRSAIDEYTTLRIESARRFIKDGDYAKAKKNLVNVVKLSDDKTAKDMLAYVEDQLFKLDIQKRWEAFKFKNSKRVG